MTAAIPDASTDAIVTDPPSGTDAAGWVGEALRILKPGGHLVALGGADWHRLTVAVEDEGFEVRDSLAWLHGDAFTPILLARKPLVGTVAANVLAHGTGALNVDGCRVEGGKRSPGFVGSLGAVDTSGSLMGAKTPRPNVDESQGRWPANVLLDGDAAAELDGQSAGMRAAKPSGTHVRLGKAADTDVYGTGWAGTSQAAGHDGEGASRFFPNLPDRQAVLAWLATLVTPPGGVVHDPFSLEGAA